MWDWASFVSGLIGAAVAIAVVLGTQAVAARRRLRVTGQLQAIEGINAETRELSRIREENPPAGGVALQPETLRQMNRATAAVSALGSSLDEKDSPITTWTMGKLVALVNAETPAQRYNLVTIVNTTLAGWAAGRISTEWFVRANAEVAAAPPVAAPSSESLATKVDRSSPEVAPSSFAPEVVPPAAVAVGRTGSARRRSEPSGQADEAKDRHGPSGG